MACWGDEEAPDFRMLRKGLVRAHKRHACKAKCGVWIEPGDRCLVFVYVEDGSFAADRWHEDCWHRPD